MKFMWLWHLNKDLNNNTCETKHDNEPFNDIFNGHGETLPSECKVERVMYDLVRVQAQQVAELADSFQLKEAFN